MAQHLNPPQPCHSLTSITFGLKATNVPTSNETEPQNELPKLKVPHFNQRFIRRLKVEKVLLKLPHVNLVSRFELDFSKAKRDLFKSLNVTFRIMSHIASNKVKHDKLQISRNVIQAHVTFMFMAQHLKSRLMLKNPKRDSCPCFKIQMCFSKAQELAEYYQTFQSVNLRGNDTLLTIYYLIRSGALAGESPGFHKDLLHQLDLEFDTHGPRLGLLKSPIGD
ncbi:hypothetical protein PIB30_060244 [Stylosanthes scabra]|uniref:Uncharacterized protein n=1 Tax=Stylosanthes scabra TaxID=79078 RepID=A0ABU6YME1_9FABA|nr:hypothetical protein [Stylosanthes scabra]